MDSHAYTKAGVCPAAADLWNKCEHPSARATDGNECNCLLGFIHDVTMWRSEDLLMSTLSKVDKNYFDKTQLNTILKFCNFTSYF